MQMFELISYYNIALNVGIEIADSRFTMVAYI